MFRSSTDTKSLPLIIAVVSLCKKSCLFLRTFLCSFFTATTFLYQFFERSLARLNFRWARLRCLKELDKNIGCSTKVPSDSTAKFEMPTSIPVCFSQGVDAFLSTSHCTHK